MPTTEHGNHLRLAQLLLSGGNENTMTAALLPTLPQLLPGRLEAVFDVSNDGGRPDVTLRGALITHRFGLDQVDEAFATLRDKPDGFIKSVVRIR